MSKFSFVIFAILLLAVTIPGQCESDQSNEIRDYDITVNSLDNGKYKIEQVSENANSSGTIQFDRR